MQIYFGGAWREITSGQIFANGAWRNLVQIQEYFSANWREVANFASSGSGGSLSLVASPDEIDTHGTTDLTSAQFTATPAGGLAPYTYLWAFTSQDGGVVFSINSPTLAITTVTMTGTLGPNSSKIATLQCTVTDSLGTTCDQQ
jgi:hypothetical protein